jgi:hypothetical protein
MLTFECHYCDWNTLIPINDDNLLRLEKVICEQCGKINWLYHSRLNPCTFSNEAVIVDEAHHAVTLRPGVEWPV